MTEADFENGSGDVYVDLGFTAREAEELTVRSELIIAIKRAIADQKLTQVSAARLCNTDQPTLSKVLQGKMQSVTIDRLALWLTALGQDVEIIVRPAPATRHGRLHVAA